MQLPWKFRAIFYPDAYIPWLILLNLSKTITSVQYGLYNMTADAFWFNVIQLALMFILNTWVYIYFINWLIPTLII